jgi:signal peptidase
MLVFLLAMIAGAILGQPILLGYVETGSMEPTLSPGDGFVAVPSALTDIEQGDVITFRAEEIQSGGLTTHRVVGQTADGFVTRGDANPFTDQDGEEPPVKREQIVAEVFQVGGNVVVVPNLGTGVEVVQDVLTLVQTWIAELIGFQTFLGTKGLAYLFFAFTVIYYVAGEYRDRNARDDEQRSRSRDTGLDPRLVLGAFAAILVLGATATMAGPAGPRQFGTVSAEFQSDRPDVIPMGESKNRTYRVPNSGLVPTVVFLEPGSDQVEIAPHEHHLGPRTTANATLTLHAPPDTGYYRYYVTEHRYLAVLPTSTIRTLYGMHPWLPVVVIDALIAGAFLALTLPFVGSGRIRDRSRDGAHRSILTRLVR